MLVYIHIFFLPEQDGSDSIPAAITSSKRVVGFLMPRSSIGRIFYD
jgi:hypothetical protein